MEGTARVTGLEALVLGVLQGLTEFLPVSSKGHLVMGQTLLGVQLESLTFEILVHVATLSAVVVVYRGRLLRIVRERDFSYVLKLAGACVPVGVLGLLLKERVEAIFHDPAVTGFGLLFTGCVLFGLRFLPPAQREQPTWLGALLIGLAQTLALLPGVSRSGMTISAALAVGLSGAAAAEFSFLLSIPVILGAAGLQALTAPLEADLGARALTIAFCAAFAAGIVALYAVYHVLRGQRFSDFAWYCWPAGGAFLLYLTLR
ncbi:MAG: undecaprenyl-diphosphate phosphatase [Gemmatimonadota bacterium]